eukprot:TRINITY_DN14523_c0_g2_i1.p1 TRINITY_DN14523_c0_g2~~TRINITY_DN14523_c0_g2_i1.p1  ORF type:complete len:120 (+),score=12.37 TRINITY_DN14523_c0_g2_i1:260-619(+)
MGYAARTKKNVDDSTATLVIRLHEGNGTDKTIGYCQSRTWGYGERGCSKFNGYRPVLVLNSLDIQENVPKIVDFVSKYHVRILNVAGHRETTAGVVDFTNSCKQLLVVAFSQIAESFRN